MSARRETHRYPDPLRAAGACALSILKHVESAIAERGTANIAISGGSSPKPMFQDFASSSFDWSRVHLFWVDERGVPPTDPQSNFKFTSDYWLAPGKFPVSNIHRIQAELAPPKAAKLYREDIVRHFGLATGELPKFDLIHRGMGPDGHTASLFPGEALIDDLSDIAAAVWVQKMNQWRITLLPGVLEAARHTVLLVTGADKVQALRAVLGGPYDPKQYPCQIAAQESEWFLDEAAAEGLP
jgi:6-phosphogluconolactonase